MESNISTVEAEYIKNLQQQIYFLELEAGFLREQTKKAKSLQPKLNSEAGHILKKLQDLRSQYSGLQLEAKRTDAKLLMMQRDRDNLRGETQSMEEAHSKEKQKLVEEIVHLKKMKELTDLQVSQKEMEILKSKQELERELVSLFSSEQKVCSLQSQHTDQKMSFETDPSMSASLYDGLVTEGRSLESLITQLVRFQIKQRLEQQKSIESQLADKRIDLLKVNSAKHEMEEKLHKHTAAIQDHITLELRNEISFLHQQLREKDLQSEQDRILRSKIMADCVSLTSENNALHTRILELNKQLEIQRALKEDNYSLDSSSFAQLLNVKDRDEHLNKEVKQQQELLQLEKIRFKDLMEQIDHLQSGNKFQDLNTATIRSCIAELQAVLDKEQQINTELQRDKSLLVDHVTNLQSQIVNKDAELLHISSRIEDLESRMSFFKSDQALRRSLQSERWRGISNMAGSMKNLSIPLSGTSVSFEK